MIYLQTSTVKIGVRDICVRDKETIRITAGQLEIPKYTVPNLFQILLLNKAAVATVFALEKPGRIHRGVRNLS